MIHVSVIVTDPQLRERLRHLAGSSRIEVAPDPTAAWTAGTDVLIVDEHQALAGDADDTPGLLVIGDTKQAIRFARRSGASAWGVLPAAVDRRQLQGAIEAVAAGLVVVPPGLASATPDAPPEDEDGIDAEPLTARELDVLGLVAQGLPNREVARELAISEHTVKFHLAAVYGKLRASTRTDAVRRALRRGLIDL